MSAQPTRPVLPDPSGRRTPDRPYAVVTLGKFDGVHAGHRQVIAHLIEEAAKRGAEPVALILDPHPRAILSGEMPDLLTTVAERRRRLASLGVPHAELLAFTHSLASLTPEDFVARLAAHFRLAALVVGPDFVFGRGRAGDLTTLRALASIGGFDVVVVPPLAIDGEVVSSRRIRDLLAGGRVHMARTLLEVPHLVEGTVVRGAARGRSLGFPTANLYLCEPFVLPMNGIYAVRSHWFDDASARHADGVASVGVRPTFDNGERLLEVFLLDCDQDLYGRQMQVEFIDYLRPEERFSSVEALVLQIRADVERARWVLVRDAQAAEGHS